MWKTQLPGEKSENNFRKDFWTILKDYGKILLKNLLIASVRIVRDLSIKCVRIQNSPGLLELECMLEKS